MRHLLTNISTACQQFSRNTIFSLKWAGVAPSVVWSGYDLDDQGYVVRFSAGTTDLLSPKSPSSVPTTSSFPSDKWAGERRWLPPSAAEVRNEWRQTSTLPHTHTHTPSCSIQKYSISLILQHKRHDFHSSLGSATRQQKAYEPTTLRISSSAVFCHTYSDSNSNLASRRQQHPDVRRSDSKT